MRQLIHRLGAVGCVLAVAACAGTNTPNATATVSRPPAKPITAPTANDVQLAQRASSLAQVRELQAQQQHLAALAHLRQHANRWGDSAETRFLQAESLRATDQNTDARTLYRGLLVGDAAGLAHRGLGLIAARNGDVATAVSELEQAAQARPTDPVVLSDWGYALLLANRVQEARWPLMTALQLAPQEPKFQANAALYLLRAGETAAAERLLSDSALPDGARQAIRQQGLLTAAQSNGDTSAQQPPLTTMQMAPRLGASPAPQ